MNVPVIAVQWLFKDSIMDQLAYSGAFPRLRDYPHLGLLVARLHFHENPIFFRWRFTACSKSAT